ncbi:MAG: copper chaperone PCu(A)C, partial [Chloroflexi bacterium]
MKPVEKIVIPAGESAVLQPGGLHVMLIGLQRELKKGDSFTLTLRFEKSPPQTVNVTVRESMGAE